MPNPEYFRQWRKNHPESCREYFSRWYKKKRFIYNARRRARIATDPEYRQKENARRRKYRRTQTEIQRDRANARRRTPEYRAKRNKYSREYRKAHLEKFRARDRKYYRANRDRILANQRKYYRKRKGDTEK